MNSIVPILVMTLIVVTVGGLLVLVAYLLGGQSKSNPIKSMPYECGLPGQPAPKTNISVRYYLTAILFIVFDIEILFMYPWALTYKDFMDAGQGLYIFLAMFIFIGLFLFGLVWEIKSKALEWD